MGGGQGGRARGGGVTIVVAGLDACGVSLDNFLEKNKGYVVAKHASLLGGAGNGLLADLDGAAAGEGSPRTQQNGCTVSFDNGGTCHVMPFPCL